MKKEKKRKNGWFLDWNVLSICSYFTESVSLNNTLLFHEDVIFSNVRATSGYLSRFVTSSPVHCGALCQQKDTCISFFHTKPTGVCQLHDVHLEFSTLSAEGNLETSRETNYFVTEQGSVLFSFLCKIVIYQYVMLSCLHKITQKSWKQWSHSV